MSELALTFPGFSLLGTAEHEGWLIEPLCHMVHSHLIGDYLTLSSLIRDVQTKLTTQLLAQCLKVLTALVVKWGICFTMNLAV